MRIEKNYIGWECDVFFETSHGKTLVEKEGKINSRCHAGLLESSVTNLVTRYSHLGVRKEFQLVKAELAEARFPQVHFEIILDLM